MKLKTILEVYLPSVSTTGQGPIPSQYGTSPSPLDTLGPRSIQKDDPKAHMTIYGERPHDHNEEDTDTDTEADDEDIDQPKKKFDTDEKIDG